MAGWPMPCANASGTLLAAVAMALSAAAIVVALRGQRLAWQPGETVIVGLATCMVTLVLAEWAFRLFTE